MKCSQDEGNGTGSSPPQNLSYKARVLSSLASPPPGPPNPADGGLLNFGCCFLSWEDAVGESNRGRWPVPDEGVGLRREGGGEVVGSETRIRFPYFDFAGVSFVKTAEVPVEEAERTPLREVLVVPPPGFGGDGTGDLKLRGFPTGVGSSLS